MELLYVYCHGFLSTNRTSKGNTLAKWANQFVDHRQVVEGHSLCSTLTNKYKGTEEPWIFCRCHEIRLGGYPFIDIHPVNLNRGKSCKTLSIESALATLDEYYTQADTLRRERQSSSYFAPKVGCLKLRMIASSFGGFVAAMFSQRYPKRVESIIFINPSVGIADRLLSPKGPFNIGPNAIFEWQEEGNHKFEMTFAPQDEVEVDFRFAADILEFASDMLCKTREDLENILERRKTEPFKSFPEYQCPSLWLHGGNDHIVPIKDAERFLEDHPTQRAITTFVCVDDADHCFTTEDSLDKLKEHVTPFWFER